MRNICAVLAAYSIVNMVYAADATRPTVSVTIKSEMHEPIVINIPETGKGLDIYAAYLEHTHRLEIEQKGQGIEASKRVLQPHYFFALFDRGRALLPSEVYHSRYLDRTFDVMVFTGTLGGLEIPNEALEVGYSLWTSDNMWGYWFNWIDTKFARKKQDVWS